MGNMVVYRGVMKKKRGISWVKSGAKVGREGRGEGRGVCPEKGWPCKNEAAIFITCDRIWTLKVLCNTICGGKEVR